MSSIITNRAALQALQAVNAAGRDLAATQNRVSTGLAVAGPKDNGAIFAIAQNMRAEIGGWNAVNGSLARAQSALDIASAGSESISDLINELQQRAAAFADASLGTRSRDALRADMEALLRQIDQVAKTSTFDGINLLTGRPTVRTDTTIHYALPNSSLAPADFATTMAALPPGSTAYTSQTATYALPPGTSTPPSFEAALATITGSNSQTVTVDAGPDAGRVSLMLDAYGYPDIAEIWQNGVRVAATGQPAATGGAPVPAGVAVAYQHILTFDYDPAAGQDLEFRFNENVTVSGTAWRVGGLVMGDPTDPPPILIPTVENSTQVRTAAEFDPPRATANPEQVAQALGIQPEGVSANFTLDGGPDAGRVDMLFDAFDLPDAVEVFQGGVRVAATGQPYVSGGGAVGSATALAGRQVISFDYDPAKGPITFSFNGGWADPNSAWVVGSLTLRPISEAPPVGQSNAVGTYAPGFSPVNYDFLSSPDGSHIRVSSRDLTPLGLGLDPMDWENPARVLAAIKAASSTVIEAATYFGQRNTLVGATRTHNAKLADTLETGIGNLVDADLAKESAKLQAQQIRQQLAVQTLGIANAEPQWMLKLFRS
ncbi:flagellin [Brevundimonas vesicularis]|uniref:Flagellin n=1 Tax=Brevundimonas vesicularis TaxID=41276 RepID=A0ABU4KRS1_BREVE|nr:flagellin [Brevundimonas vesicularis]MDX2335527.1 flagellin [Brevundimonas vesicularis]